MNMKRIDRLSYYSSYIVNIKKRCFDLPVFLIKHRGYIKELKRNKEFKNKYHGERCFIIGNGPSLKSLDFSLLKNEYTFSVNQLMRNEHFKELETNFHVFTDDRFFNIDSEKPEDLELLNHIKSINSYDNFPCVFFPITQFKFSQKYELDKDLKLYFLYNTLRFRSNIKNINYTKCTFDFGTVIQTCITLAIYMGFSEIYLLGCDNTGIISVIETFLEGKTDNYGYEISDNEQKRMRNQLEKGSISSFAFDYFSICRDYILLYEYCQKNDIKLVNCTEKSAIDLIPHANLNDILKNNKGKTKDENSRISTHKNE